MWYVIHFVLHLLLQIKHHGKQNKKVQTTKW